MIGRTIGRMIGMLAGRARLSVERTLEISALERLRAIVGHSRATQASGTPPSAVLRVAFRLWPADSGAPRGTSDPVQAIPRLQWLGMAPIRLAPRFGGSRDPRGNGATKLV